MSKSMDIVVMCKIVVLRNSLYLFEVFGHLRHIVYSSLACLIDIALRCVYKSKLVSVFMRVAQSAKVRVSTGAALHYPESDNMTAC